MNGHRWHPHVGGRIRGALAVCGAIGLLAVAGCAVTPGNPGAVDVTFSINAFSGPNHPISPLIYGVNSMSDLSTNRPTMLRPGGNRWTAYNWENNASNAGSDWLLPERRLPVGVQHAGRGGRADASTRPRRAGAAAMRDRSRSSTTSRPTRTAACDVRELGRRTTCRPASSRTGRRRAARSR